MIRPPFVSPAEFRCAGPATGRRRVPARVSRATARAFASGISLVTQQSRAPARVTTQRHWNGCMVDCLRTPVAECNIAASTTWFFTFAPLPTARQPCAQPDGSEAQGSAARGLADRCRAGIAPAAQCRPGMRIRVRCRRSGVRRGLEEFAPDLILSDFSLPLFDGLSALEIARARRPDTPYIFVSGTIGEERAIESIKRGATDYVLKSNLRRLPAAITRALNEARERAALQGGRAGVAGERRALPPAGQRRHDYAIFMLDAAGAW